MYDDPFQSRNCFEEKNQNDKSNFCNEIRKLFEKADPHMGASMKLELLLAKVNPGYRLDLCKQKPSNPEEFEMMAKALENTSCFGRC